MRCTNYSLPLFKLLKEAFNPAAADYIASIIESDSFQKWYGSTEIPITDFGPTIKNQAGQEWDMVKTIDNWLTQNEHAAGFRDSQGERIRYNVDEPGIYKKLTDIKNDYNKKDGPFKAEVWNMGDTYNLALMFNHDYKKVSEKGLISAEPQPKPEHRTAFYFNNIKPEVLKSGKNLSIRPDLCTEGLYQVGNDYYRVSLKYDKPIYLREASEKISELKERMINDEDAGEYKLTKDFFAGRAPMFIYEIKKVDMTEEKAKGLPDFMGIMSIKPNKKARGAKFLTGYTDVDKYLKALAETKDALYRQRTAAKGNLAKVQELDARIDIIKHQMDKLHKEARVDTITSVGRVIMAQLNKDLDKSQTFGQLNEALRLAKAWKEIDKVVEFNPKNPDEEDLATLEEAKEVRSSAQTLFQAYFNKYRDKVLDMIDDKLGMDASGQPKSFNVIDDNGEIRILDVDKSGAMGIGIAFSANEIEQLVDHLIKESEFKALDEDYEFNKRLEQAIIDLTGKGYKHSKASDFNFIFTKDSHGNSSLVTKYNREFHKELAINRYKAFDKHRMSKDRSENYKNAVLLGATVADFKGEMTAKQYYEFERKHYDYILTEEGKQEFKDYMEMQRQSHILNYDEAGDPIYDEAALKKIQEEYDPEVFQKWLNGDSKIYNSGSRWFTKQIKNDTPFTKEYSAMNEKQRKFYDFFTHEFIQGQQDIVVDYRFTDVDLDRQLIDFVIGMPGELKDKTAYMGKKVKSFIENIAGVRYYEDENVRVPSRALTGVEHIGIEFKKVGDFIPDPNSTTKANPVEILKNFRLAGHMFKQRRQVEDALNAIRDLSLNAEKAEMTADGRAKKDIVGKVFTSKNKTNVADRIDYNVKAALTGKVKEDYKTVTKGGKPGEWKFSVGKTVDSINNYTRFKAMALSPLSATGNLVMGTINNAIYAAGGQFFSDKELSQAYWIIKSAISRYYSAVPGTDGRFQIGDKQAAKVAEILHRYNLIGDVTEKMYHNGDFFAWFFTLQKSGEFLSQGATSIAQMLRTKIKTKDGEKTMWDMFEMGKDNKVTFRQDLLEEDSEYNNPEKLHFFFEKIRKVNQKIHGDYQNPLMIKKDVVGRVFMLFRTWLPMAIKERFGGKYIDYLLGEQKGRYISFGQLLGRSFKGGENLKETGKLIMKLLLPIVGRKIKINGSELDVANIDMAVRELHFVLGLMLACIALKAQVDDDDDEQTKSLLRYLYNQGERAQSELQFFFSPKDEMQILRDIIPLYSTFRDGTRALTRTWNLIIDPESDTYKRGFRKGHSKAGVAWQEFAPVLRSVQKTWSASEQIFSDTRYQ